MCKTTSLGVSDSIRLGGAGGPIQVSVCGISEDKEGLSAHLMVVTKRGRVTEVDVGEGQTLPLFAGSKSEVHLTLIGCDSSHQNRVVLGVTPDESLIRTLPFGQVSRRPKEEVWKGL